MWLGGYFFPFIHVGGIAYYLIAVSLLVLLLFTHIQKDVPRLNLIYIILFVAGIVFSMFMAMIYHYQPLLGTAISQRPVYFLLCFFIWWKIGLTEEELFPMFRVLTIITLAVFTLSLFEPQWFLSSAVIEDHLSRKDTSTDVLCFMPGHLYAILYLFYLLQSIPERFSKMDWAIVLATLAMFFVYQNRSTLIYLGIILLYFVIKNRSKIGRGGRMTVVLSAIVVLLFGFPYIRTIAKSLIGETQEQLADNEYARKVAYQYYVFDYNKGSIPRILFGNGQPTNGSEYILEMQEGHEMGAHWNDIGFIGDWFLFGMLPIIAILMMAYLVFRYPFPMYLKYLFASFLLVPTIHTFSANNYYAFYFSLVMYLVCLNECQLSSLEPMSPEGAVEDLEQLQLQNA